jgi:hypothetical protein
MGRIFKVRDAIYQFSGEFTLGNRIYPGIAARLSALSDAP